MGQEVVCAAQVDGRRVQGKALLESDELLFRGDERLRIPFSAIRSATAADGVLAVEHDGGVATFELGPRAARWAERITNPPTIVDKLGVKPGMRVALDGVDDQAFRELLRERTASIANREPAEPVDVLVVQIDEPAGLAVIGGLERSIKRDGSIWIVFPRGRTDLRETDVLEAGRAVGLVDTKTACFSETHTSNRFQIPKDRR